MGEPMSTTAPHEAAGDALREELCACLWAEAHPGTVTWPEVVIMAAHHPQCMGARHARAIRSHADALISGPLAPVLAARATAEAERDEAREALQEIRAWLEIMRPLSRKATGGPWYHYDEVFRRQFGQRRITEVQVRRTGKAIVCWGGFDGLPPVTARKKNANAALIVSAVNGVRRWIREMDRRTALRHQSDPEPGHDR